MKTKDFRKKLSLNKKTIVNLSDVEKVSIYGGQVTDPPTTCFYTIRTCCTWWQTCETALNSDCS